jgi:hypothetical protein
MALLTNSDLRYPYSGTATSNDDPKLRGEPDRSLFNRHEKYEVLYLINKFAEKNGFKNKASGQKVEKLIKEHLPPHVRSQEHVVQWLEDNWDKY